MVDCRTTRLTEEGQRKVKVGRKRCAGNDAVTLCNEPGFDLNVQGSEVYKMRRIDAAKGLVIVLACSGVPGGATMQVVGPSAAVIAPAASVISAGTFIWYLSVAAVTRQAVQSSQDVIQNVQENLDSLTFEATEGANKVMRTFFAGTSGVIQVVCLCGCLTILGWFGRRWLRLSRTPLFPEQSVEVRSEPQASRIQGRLRGGMRSENSPKTPVSNLLEEGGTEESRLTLAEVGWRDPDGDAYPVHPAT